MYNTIFCKIKILYLKKVRIQIKQSNFEPDEQMKARTAKLPWLNMPGRERPFTEKNDNVYCRFKQFTAVLTRPG